MFSYQNSLKVDLCAPHAPAYRGAVQDRVSQIVSLSGFISLFIEICRAPWTEDQPVEMLLPIRNNSGTEHKVTLTLRDGFETAIPESGVSTQETHCVVRPYLLVHRTKRLPRNVAKVLLP